jgi:hypothetical protein
MIRRILFYHYSKIKMFFYVCVIKVNQSALGPRSWLWPVLLMCDP